MLGQHLNYTDNRGQMQTSLGPRSWESDADSNVQLEGLYVLCNVCTGTQYLQP